MAEPSPDAAAIGPLVDRIRPILVGHPPQVQGAVLADLVATFIVGHRGKPAEMTRALREFAMMAFIDLVRELIPENEAIAKAERRT
jgi:hypothetical protein